jgi:hypothetical protein
MVESSSSNGSPGANEQGVFANLPHTRPQRASPRRAAARNRSSSAAEPARKRDGSSPAARKAAHARARTSRATAKTSQATAKPSQAAPRRRAAAAAGARAQQAPAPRQGFESERDRSSRSLQPPGAADLVVSAAELVTEIAKAGLARGERLVRDLVSRRP